MTVNSSANSVILIVFAFSDNLSAENSKLSSDSANRGNHLFGCMGYLCVKLSEIVQKIREQNYYVKICSSGKREKPYNHWEPIYIGTNQVHLSAMPGSKHLIWKLSIAHSLALVMNTEYRYRELCQDLLKWPCTTAYLHHHLSATQPSCTTSSKKTKQIRASLLSRMF